MGIAAYNRGSKVISQIIDRELRPVEFEVMERLNSLEKLPKAQKPFGPIHFISDHHGFWAECPVTGFGYCYKSLSEAVRSWRVQITSFDNGIWIAQP